MSDASLTPSAPRHQPPRKAPSATADATAGDPVEQQPPSGGWTGVPAYFFAGILMLGVPGWLLDRHLGTRGFVAVGILAGLALAMYVVWVRYVGAAGGPHRRARRDEESD